MSKRLILASAIPAILAAMPAAILAQVIQTQTQTVNMVQSASLLEEGFVYWDDDDRDLCFASSRTWRVISNRNATGIRLRLDRVLRDRVDDDRDWQLADAPALALISSRREIDRRITFDYRAFLTYEIGGQRVKYAGPGAGGFYWLTAFEQPPPDSSVQAALPYRDTEVAMGAGFADLVAPETGIAAQDFDLAVYVRFRLPRPTRRELWGDWRVEAIQIELPTAGLARAIRSQRGCPASLP